jgi:hypothetical protein
MKRASTLSTLLDTSTPWLSWWQELILNWAASWQSIETLHITSSKTDRKPPGTYQLTWSCKRMELEQLLDPELGQR